MTKLTKRGEVYFADLDPVKGSEQGGVRPVLVVQSDSSSRNAPTAIVLPITSREKPALSTHVPLTGTKGLSDTSIALAEQVRTIDKARLGHYVGRVSAPQMAAADAALRFVLGLSPAIRSEVSDIKTLCPRCKSDYESAGFELIRIGNRHS